MAGLLLRSVVSSDIPRTDSVHRSGYFNDQTFHIGVVSGQRFYYVVLQLNSLLVILILVDGSALFHFKNIMQIRAIGLCGSDKYK